MRSPVLASALVLALCGCDRPTQSDRVPPRAPDPTPVEIPPTVVPEAMQPRELPASAPRTLARDQAVVAAETPSAPGSPPEGAPTDDEDDDRAEEGMPAPLEADAALLFEHPDNPCREDEHCAFALSAMTSHGSGLRVGLLEVWKHDGEVGADFPSWRGAQDAALTLRLAIQLPGEPLRWGPTVAGYDADMAESIAVEARVELVALVGRPTPLVRVITDLSVREMCCGGRSTTDLSEDALCALHAASEPSACVHALVEHVFEGSAEDPSDELYGGGASRYRASATVNERELRVTAMEGSAPSYVVTPGDDRFAVHHRLPTGSFDLGSL